MGFPMLRFGIIPLWLVISTFSLDCIKETVYSFLRIIGIDLRQPAPPLERRIATWRNSGEQDHEQSSADTWDHIRSLPEEIRDALTLVSIESVADRFCEEEDAVCAICFCEYERDDPVWLLPSCVHIFHKRCLDRWLDQNQTTCPTCRASILTEELARKSKQREEELMAELALWFSFYHGSALVRNPWYSRHAFHHWLH